MLVVTGATLWSCGSALLYSLFFYISLKHFQYTFFPSTYYWAHCRPPASGFLRTDEFSSWLCALRHLRNSAVFSELGSGKPDCYPFQISARIFLRFSEYKWQL